MAWTTPRTWSAGEIVRAATMNEHIRDNLNALRDDASTHETKTNAAATYETKAAAAAAALTFARPHPLDLDLGDPTTLVTSASHNGFPYALIAADRRVLLTYRSGTSHSGGKGAIKIRSSVDKMVTFSAATDAALDATYDVRDPCLALLSDDRVALSFYLFDHTTDPDSTLVDAPRVAFSSDNGATFGTPVVVDTALTGGSACSAPVVELSDGTLLLPVYGKNSGDTFDSARLMASDDAGVTWTQRSVLGDGPTDGRHYQEPNVIVTPNGDLLALLRSDTTNSIHQRRSTDGGLTWDEQEVAFASASGAPRLTVQSGHVHVLYRTTSTGKRPVTRASADNGQTWADAVVVDSTSTMTVSAYGNALPFGRESIRYVYAVENAGGSVADVMLVDAITPADQAAWIAAKGDLLVGTGEDRATRLAAPAINGRVLVGDSTATGGLAWSGARGVRCKNTAAISIANNTVTPLTFSSEDFDTDAFHDTSTNTTRVTIPAGLAGLYLLTGTVYYATATTGQRQARLHKNGVLIPGGMSSLVVPAADSSEVSAAVSTVIDLAVGDYIELCAYQTSGAALDARFENTSLSLVRLGAYT